MLDIERIRQLVDMMIANDLVELSLRDGDVEVNLRRPNSRTSEGVVGAGGPAGTGNPSLAAAVLPATDEPVGDEADAEPELLEIKSPMVGTFYAGSDPDSPPFVHVGSRVHTDSVVCIVEAMKVFNEIKAETSGTIHRVLVKNEQPVEYGQPLFLVRPE